MSTQIKSFEEATGGLFGDILSNKKENKKIKIGLLTCGYFEYWRMYPNTLKNNVEQDLEKITKKFTGEFQNVVCSSMVDTLDSAEEAGVLFRTENIDVLIIVAGTYVPDFISLHVINYIKNVPILFYSTQISDHVDKKGNYEHSLRNSGIIGIAQLTGTLRKMGRKYKVVVGTIDDERAYEKMRSFLLANQAVSDLKESNIGVIGHVFRGMYDLELSKTFLKSKFDVNVIYIQNSHLMSEWEKVSEAEVIVISQGLLKRFKKRNVTDDDIHRAVRLAIAMKNLAERFKLDAMCFLDQHYVQKQTLTTARMGASLLMEHSHMTVTCEGDLGGLVTMMLMKSASGIPAFMGEWGEYDLSTNSCLIMGHGIGVPALASGDEQITLTRTPEEWGFSGAGLNYELIVKPGKVTISHIIETQEGYKMLISPAESIEHPTLPYEELHAMLQVKQPVKEYLEQVLENGVTHHCIVGLTDMADVLINVAELLEVEKFYIE